MSDNLIHASVQSLEGYTTECSSGNHSYVLDEPTDAGGNGLGMNPLQSLLSSMGACALITAKAAAPKRKIDLIDIRIDLEGEYGRNSEGKRQLTAITSKFHIKANNTQEEIDKFIDFVLKHCPVHNTIKFDTEMKTEVTLES